jgi:hypothetical protein
MANGTPRRTTHVFTDFSHLTHHLLPVPVLQLSSEHPSHHHPSDHIIIQLTVTSHHHHISSSSSRMDNVRIMTAAWMITWMITMQSNEFGFLDCSARSYPHG